jgi:RNA polymerase sigma-70 factor (sigma-B/F/G subfamily)
MVRASSLSSHDKYTDRPRKADLNGEARSRVTTSLLREAALAGDHERRDLHARVIVLHLDVADSVAWRYCGRGQDHQDLVQVARLGLVEAVERFDPERGSFLAFAVPTMVGHVKRHFRDHTWVVRPPRPIQERHHEITRARDDLSRGLCRPPTTTEIAGHLNMAVEDVREAMNIQGCYQPTSLDAGVSESGNNFSPRYADTLGEDQPELANVETLATVSPACLLLPPEDRELLFLRFFVLCSQEEIGAQLGISQMQVSRRLKRILTQLREEIGGLDTPTEPLHHPRIGTPITATPRLRQGDIQPAAA